MCSKKRGISITDVVVSRSYFNGPFYREMEAFSFINPSSNTKMTVVNTSASFEDPHRFAVFRAYKVEMSSSLPMTVSENGCTELATSSRHVQHLPSFLGVVPAFTSFCRRGRRKFKMRSTSRLFKLHSYLISHIYLALFCVPSFTVQHDLGAVHGVS